MCFFKGDIVWPENRTADPEKLRHPAIVWDEKTDGRNDFTGIMITSSGPGNGYDNIKMKPAHFVEGWAVVCKNSHFVNQKFQKFAYLGPFKKVGALTDEGIAFIEKNISEKEPIPFEEYKKSK